MTMTLVSTVTVGAGGAASIDFTSIPQTGTDLLVVLSLRNSATASSTELRFNGNSSGYSFRRLYGSGSSATSDTLSSQTNIDIYGALTSTSQTSNTFSNVAVYVPNYAGSTNKSVSIDTVTENNATAAVQAIYAGLWANTSAITSVSFGNYAGNFVQYSTASLYTITKGSGGATVS